MVESKRQRERSANSTPRQKTVELAELTTKARKKLKKGSFAVPSKAPGSGSYPIPDRAHAQNALARVSQFGTPTEKAQVKAAVKKKFPTMGKKTAKKSGRR